MSDPHDYPAPHIVVITETAGHQPTPVLIPNSLTIDGHEVGHKVAAGGWDITAGPHGEAILGLRVDSDAVTVDETGGVYVDGHQLCWPAGYEPASETSDEERQCCAWLPRFGRRCSHKAVAGAFCCWHC